MPAVLSVYLSKGGLDAPSAGELLTVFHSLVHNNLSLVQKKEWQSGLQKIDNYLRQAYDGRGKRSVVFFVSDKNLWQVQTFEFVLDPKIVISEKSEFSSIEKAKKNYGKYLVLLIDREKARLFTVNLGKMEEHRDFLELIVPKKVKAKKDMYGRDDKIFRHSEDHLSHHLSHIAYAVEEFCKMKNIRFIILGGHRELFSKMKKHLFYPQNKMVKGEFVTEVNIPLNDIFFKSKKIAAQLR